jgi:pimeloyl-ACP methyl ester carboxylesterase
MSAGLAYDVTGEGEPMLLIHGLGAHRGTWDDVLPRLASEYRVYRVDLKGFGRSPKPRDDAYSVVDQAACVRELVAELGLDRLILVGHSLGGAVSLVLAAEKPALVSRLVLLGAPAYASDIPLALRLVRYRPMQWLLREAPVSWILPFVVYRAYKNWSVLTKERMGSYREPLESEDARHAVIQTALRASHDRVQELSGRHARVTAPTLLVWGDRDSIIPVSTGVRLSEELPRARLVVIPRCGHVPQEERPEETVDAILAFLSATSKA